MDKIDIKYDIVKECLSKIVSYTIWMGSIDLILLYGILQKQNNITIGQLTIFSKYITFCMFCILMYFTISLIHKIDRINGIFKSLKDSEERKVIKTYLNLYPSILNPFAEHRDVAISKLLDNLGLGLQTFFYLSGFLLSIQYLVVNNIWGIIISLSLSVVLIIFRRDLLNLEHGMKGIVSSENQQYKIFFHQFFVVLVFILYFLSKVYLDSFK